MEPYELLSDALSIFIELLLNVCTTIIKLIIILACIITIYSDLFVEIFGIYVIQFSSGVLQMLVQESQHLFALTKAIVIMVWQTISDHYCKQRIQQHMQAFSTLVILFFLLMYEHLDNSLFSFCWNRNVSI